MADGSRSEFSVEELLEQQHESIEELLELQHQNIVVLKSSFNNYFDEFNSKMDLMMEMLRGLSNDIRTLSSPSENGSEFPTMDLQQPIGVTVSTTDSPLSTTSFEVTVNPIVEVLHDDEWLGLEENDGSDYVKTVHSETSCDEGSEIEVHQVEIFISTTQIEVKGVNDGSVFDKIVVQNDAHKVFVEMSEPIVEEDLLGIEGTNAAHYMLDEWAKLSSYDSDEEDHEDAVDKNQVDFDPNEFTMGEKLEKLELVDSNKAKPLENTKSPHDARPPSADSIHVLLKQALQADNRTLLVDCLYRQDEKVITNSVSQLNPSDVVKLLQALVPIVETRGAVLAYSIPWLRTLLLQHASGIMSQESSLLSLSTLNQLIKSRVATFSQALQLSSSLDLLLVMRFTYILAIISDDDKSNWVSGLLINLSKFSTQDVRKGLSTSENEVRIDFEKRHGKGNIQELLNYSNVYGEFMVYNHLFVENCCRYFDPGGYFLPQMDRDVLKIDDDFWLSGMLPFIFDPGGCSRPHMGCGSLECNNEQEDCCWAANVAEFPIIEVPWIMCDHHMDYMDFIQGTGRVLYFSEKPKGNELKAMAVDTTVLVLSRDEAEKKPYIASMGVYVFKKEILLNLLRWRIPTAIDFGIGEHSRIKGCIIVDVENFVWDPGQNVIFLYILEDKDVFERVGKNVVFMDTTLEMTGLIMMLGCLSGQPFWNPDWDALYASCCISDRLGDTVVALDDIGLIPNALVFSTAELKHYI